MTHFVRTADENFLGLLDYPYEPNYLEIDELRMHYVDDGPKDGPVALLVHGMPTWSYLYRFMIPVLVAAGFRCIAPDHIGFGRSDKVTDPDWYNIAQHTVNLTRLVESLDLTHITLFVQDWGGPTGLAQYASMPDRFDRLVIMNTWLHHEGYEYSPGILNWIQQNSTGGLFRDNVPAKFGWGTLMAMATQRVSPQDSVFRIVAGDEPILDTEATRVRDAYDAPFRGLGEAGVAGPRRFPLSIPTNDPVAGNASEQQRHLGVVSSTELPVHFVWGVNDNVFTREWGLEWHSMIPQSTWFELDAGHFLQDTHGADIARHVLSHVK
jgi:haloalkane dehalogenase